MALLASSPENSAVIMSDRTPAVSAYPVNFSRKACSVKLRLSHLCVLTLLLGSTSALAGRIVVLVNPASPLQKLSQQEVAAVFLGQAQGVGNQMLRPFDLPYDDPLRESFYRRIANLSLAQVQARWARQLFSGRASVPKVAASSEAALALLEERPEAIVYVDADAVDERRHKIVFVLP
ncbi:MAG: hypothetical protein QG667_2389 [Pseudomonadota bacterium]|jgi:hypothetical protein|nr:hypothetical protein [Pseudomonadota bacterium]